MKSLQIATQYLESDLKGRYITNDHIKPLLQKLNNPFLVKKIGLSVLGKDIFSFEYGIGNTKILMWSQMHGNESTTTKALFDFINYINNDTDFAKYVYQNFTIIGIPILNPDGASTYTRVNANEVDLNRDSFDITQPESKVLRSQIESFKPDFCFNLHDQRTIFGIFESKLPATTAFLAPSYNNKREYNEVRLKAVSVINAINNELQNYINGQVSRFDDTFNKNCIGDYCTFKGIPTILFEAGHFSLDYEREEVRKYIFIALKAAVENINVNFLTNETAFLNNYLNIPQNSKCFYDLVVKNVRIKDNSEEKIINFAAQYVEILDNNTISFIAVISEISNLKDVYGHIEVDASENDKIYAQNDFAVGEKLSIYINDSFHFINGIKQL